MRSHQLVDVKLAQEKIVFDETVAHYLESLLALQVGVDVFLCGKELL